MDIRLKHILKLNPIISKAGYFFREKRAMFRIKKYNNLPTVSSKILFATTEGRFNDSCRAIAEYIHDLGIKIEMVWVCREHEYLGEIPTYIRPVFFETEDYYKELSTSSVWVFNFLIPQGTIKRNNQLYIQVWHGDKPFKKIANEAAEFSKLYRRRTKGRKFSENELCDYFMTGSNLYIDIWKRSVGYNGKVITSGLPRNDRLLQDSSSNNILIRKEIGIPQNVMVLTYAPTFRDHRIDNGNIGTNIDLNAVLSFLEKKYDRKWICLKRAHGGKKIQLSNTNDSNRIIDVTNYKDMTDLLLASDMLITDYSSCAGDFAYLGRPILLYQDDFEEYTTLDRGLIFDIKKTPFFRATNMSELEKIINELNDDMIKKNCEDILELYESTQTSHSTKDIVDIILNHMSNLQQKGQNYGC